MDSEVSAATRDGKCLCCASSAVVTVRESHWHHDPFLPSEIDFVDTT
jgi:hypothetical protein